MKCQPTNRLVFETKSYLDVSQKSTFV